MTPAPLRLFNPNGPDRVAVVWVEPAYGRADAFLLKLARGQRSGQLGTGATYGPYTEAELAIPHAQLATALLREGFLPGGAHGAMDRLKSPDPAVRGRAATRLGWGGHPHAVDALLALLPTAVDEACAVIDALGRLGDPRALPAIRPYAARKLLSRRRSAVEAMRNLGDAEGLMHARARTLDELSENVREVLIPLEGGEPTEKAVSAIVEAVTAGDPKRRGLTADLLYERATPTAVRAAVAIVDQLEFDQPFAWRYVKSVLKRALLRDDFRTFGWLIHEIETRGRVTRGQRHSVKSGYDGADRLTLIFGVRTRDYLRRATWRHLRTIAAHRPHLYSAAAAEALIHYAPTDAEPPRKRYGAYASAYLFNRILFAGGDRLELIGMKFRLRKGTALTPPAGAREESFPALWDAYPQAFVRVLAAARTVEAQTFARAGVARHPGVMSAASIDDLIGMLDAPHEPTVSLAMAEITRRFDPANPDWALIERLTMDPRNAVADLGLNFLADHVAAWANDPARVAALLASPSARARALVADRVILWLGTDHSTHAELADRLIVILRSPEPAPGLHESVARVAREALADALSARLSTDELLKWIATGSPAAQGVAGDLLGRRPEAVAALGLVGVAALAQHPLAAVRSGGIALLRSAKASWATDPSVLLVLIETDWRDTRSAALALLRDHLDVARTGPAALLGMLDSNRTDVQDVAIDLARQNALLLDLPAMAARLVEHPHPHMRQFTLETVIAHLPAGPAPLAGLERFCRTILLDTWPSRREKNDLIAFLGERGLAGEEQARIAARLLDETLALAAKYDFERALAALARLRMSYPRIESGVRVPELQPGGAA
ncbi:MAG TPA: HEAT repeat domain-containing protein [Tepidisphaeraceae bacterium]|nr:HEAT repeat domain-containing protein [Tepidisphaeraceae bacterium]